MSQEQSKRASKCLSSLRKSGNKKASEGMSEGWRDGRGKQVSECVRAVAEGKRLSK